VAGLWWEVRQQAQLALIGRKSCRVWMLAHPPDHRSRDLDNLIKPLLDALQWAGIMENDRQVRGIFIQWGSVRPGGRVRVRLQVRQ
jgi:crossover junction endodeoxyribonuclease RusA